MSQLKIVFSRSLNQTQEEIRRSDLVEVLNRFNRSQRRERKKELSIEEYCLKFNIDYKEEINKPIDRLSIYKRFSKRTYNK